MSKWINIKDTAPPRGTKFDAWCVHPEIPNYGVRFTDVAMRGDGSGYGVVVHLPGSIHWEYLERAEGIYPLWIITHWMEIPEGPENGIH